MLTFDLDFGDILAITRSEAPSVVIFRLRDQTPAAVNPRLFRVIAECAAELASGAIVLVEDERFRVRRLPIQLWSPPPSFWTTSFLDDLKGAAQAAARHI